jgi:hypothetical protein
MSLSEAWDRMFWSIMLTIFVGLVWMKFLQETAACESVGLIVAVGIGLAFFGSGWYRATERNKREQQQAEETILMSEDLL